MSGQAANDWHLPCVSSTRLSWDHLSFSTSSLMLKFKITLIVILALRSMRQEDFPEFEANLVFIVSLKPVWSTELHFFSINNFLKKILSIEPSMVPHACIPRTQQMKKTWGVWSRPRVHVECVSSLGYLRSWLRKVTKFKKTPSSAWSQAQPGSKAHPGKQVWNGSGTRVPNTETLCHFHTWIPQALHD